jgi:hypothetical protein
MSEVAWHTCDTVVCGLNSHHCMVGKYVTIFIFYPFFGRVIVMFYKYSVSRFTNSLSCKARIMAGTHCTSSGLGMRTV